MESIDEVRRTMEPLREIIVKKYLAGFEKVRKSQQLTDEEYRLVKNSGLDDLLDVETNPIVLERICEGEKYQTAEFYDQQEKKYKRNVSKLYRPIKTIRPPPRAVAAAVPRINVVQPANATVPARVENVTDVANLPPEDTLEPMRTFGENEANGALYLIREELPTMEAAPLNTLPQEDENFGSADVDGARDFLELCTGTKMPPMSMRQTLTRDMLISQFSTIPPVVPVADNFQEIDLQGISTPMFKRPLGTSTPYVNPVPNQPTPLPEAAINELPELEANPMAQGSTPQPAHPTLQGTSVAEVPDKTVQSTPVGDGPRQLVCVAPGQPQEKPDDARQGVPVPESGSSSEQLDPPRARRTRKEVAFTERLEPYDGLDAASRVRRCFEIFSFPYRESWNNTVQNVQSQLFERRLQPLQEDPVMRAGVPEQQPESLQRTTEGELPQPVPMLPGDISHSLVEKRTGLDPSNLLTMQSDQLPDLTTGRPTLEPLSSLDGKMVDLVDNFRLPSSVGDSGTSAAVGGERKTATHLDIAMDAESQRPQEPGPSGVARMPEKPTVPANHQDESNLAVNMSDVLYNQALALETVADNRPAAAEMAPLSEMLVDILIAVQGEMCRRERQDGHVSLRTLRQRMNIDSSFGTAKLVKNIILLKQAGLLDVDTTPERQVQGVFLRLPECE